MCFIDDWIVAILSLIVGLLGLVVGVASLILGLLGFVVGVASLAVGVLSLVTTPVDICCGRSDSRLREQITWCLNKSRKISAVSKRLFRRIAELGMLGVRVVLCLSCAVKQQRRDKDMVERLDIPLGVVPSVLVYWRRKIR